MPAANTQSATIFGKQGEKKGELGATGAMDAAVVTIVESRRAAAAAAVRLRVCARWVYVCVGVWVGVYKIKLGAWYERLKW
jgi:hypothetical protein